MLTKGTPEGAREFLVPSRLHPGDFYVLPQSPQQFKQLLMVAGIGRYYQFVRCLRDEDQRGDRQPEFTQLDMELSFVDQEDVIGLNETMMIELVETLFPDKKITEKPFPRLTYDEAIKRYKTDKPDLRKDKTDANELAFAWVVDFPMFEKGEGNKLDAMHHPFTSPRSSDVAKLEKDPLSAKANAYDLVLNGYEVAGGSIRISDAQLQTKVFRLLGISDEEIKSRFGHMVEAFNYGVPAHGGIAYGFDRLMMIFTAEPNIREVMAFPKTGDARDPLTGAPAAVDPARLEEAHIKVVRPKVK
jgi:aspartyl-tRNA synthetase